MSNSSGYSSDSTAVDTGSAPRRSRTRVAASAMLHWPTALFFTIVRWLYYIYQDVISWVFSPVASPSPFPAGTEARLIDSASSSLQNYEPLKPGQKPYGRIAIIGAGLTGVSSAAHAVDHGFDVVIFEAEESVGGVWARENKTSQLQLNSILYRFHPTVKWSRGFPQRDEIIEQVKGVWERYKLQDSTKFKTRVTKVTRHNTSTDPRKQGHSRWIINDGKEGVFDAIICAVGTCGEPKLIKLDGQDSFRGEIVHSSQLDNADLKDKKVVIVGSGASGVEAAELAVQKEAKDIVVLARSDKWIIPRNTITDILLSLQPFGREMPLSFIPEFLIRKFHYRGLEDLSPSKEAKGLFEGTPIVNDEFLEHIRQGLVTYKRCDTKTVTPRGIKIVERGRNSKPGDPGQETVQRADVTGYVRPTVDYLPKDLFPSDEDRDYHRPSLYLQNFTVEDCSVLLTNASYQNGLGTVEMCIWIVLFHLFNPRRLPWLPFILFGWGVRPGKSSYFKHSVAKVVT
ncbi:SPOSA6832_00560 [Sporobolomyces salmonicolor]|uniref:SPOSA6832_00560-mRNA-1:cds n=1 Tax=Sporidiobolus salmonicolor TaxID=5005 RepID=A0A0D6EGE8_SPOSA|nr:SPOSA6832_00560 [Sporobolomyces salmonicolor]